MIMIITLHFLGHGGILGNVVPYSGKYYACWILEGICYVSVNCYVLISGYFLSDSKFKFHKLMAMLIQVFLISISTYTIFVLLGLTNFSWFNFFKALTPTLSSQYWFVTVYVGLYIFFPFINIVLNNITRQQHLTLTYLMIIFFSIMPTYFCYGYGLNAGGGSGIVWFVTLYIIAAYLRRYYKSTHSLLRLILLYLGFALATPFSMFFRDYISNKFNIETLSQYKNVMYYYNSVFVCASSVLLFIIFLHIKINQPSLNKIITFFSAQTFGVYLIHDNPYMRSFMWQIINVPSYLEINIIQFFIFAIIIILSIFIVSSIANHLISIILSRLYKTNLFQIILNIRILNYDR